MGVAHTSVSREIERNSIDLGWDKTKYDPLKAEKKRLERRWKANKSHIKLRRDHKQRKFLIEELKEK
jgi:IS30 family transposase